MALSFWSSLLGKCIRGAPLLRPRLLVLNSLPRGSREVVEPVLLLCLPEASLAEPWAEGLPHTWAVS